MTIKRMITSLITPALGLAVLSACSGSPTAPQAPGTGFSTQGYAYNDFNNFGTLGCGYGGYNSYGSCGYGGYGTYGYGGYGVQPIGGDIYGGLNVIGPNGRLDRQPATLPPGIAEENDVAYRPVGSAIWRRK